MLSCTEQWRTSGKQPEIFAVNNVARSKWLFVVFILTGVMRSAETYLFNRRRVVNCLAAMRGSGNSALCILGSGDVFRDVIAI